MKTTTFLTALLIVSLLWACKTDEATPQPDWTSNFMGTYAFLQPAYYYEGPGSFARQLVACARMQVIDNTHVQMVFGGNTYQIDRSGYYIYDIFDPIDGTLTYEAINQYTLVTKEVLRDNSGQTILAMDTIKAIASDTLGFRNLAFKGKVREGTEYQTFQAFRGYHDTAYRPLFWLISQNKFSLNRFVGGFVSKGAKYECDFGDGTPMVTTRSVAHEYKQNGTYTIKVKITSETGQQASEIYQLKVGNL
ncbi:MAG: PKD domain-containing protein [Spirosomataceae bacterium]